MRVVYRSIPGVVLTYEQTAPVKWCCEGMARVWGRLIGFGVRGCKRSTSRTVNLYADVPQANGRNVLEITPVDFCPFCGEAAETCWMK